MLSFSKTPGVCRNSLRVRVQQVCSGCMDVGGFDVIGTDARTQIGRQVEQIRHRYRNYRLQRKE